MPRVSKGPVWYASKRGWFANIDGNRIFLVGGPKKETEEIAHEKWEQEKTASRVQVDGDRSLTWAILNAWLQDRKNRTADKSAAERTEDTVAPNTYDKDKQ